jgi:hypothetical protein
MAFIDGNNVIQQVTAATADPAFRDSILPRTLERGSDRTDLQSSNRNWNFEPILRITVEDQRPRSQLKRKRLSQLLNDPTTRWMPRYVEVQNAPTIVADDEEAVEHTESDRRHGEEIHRGNGFPVVSKKSEPSLGRLRISEPVSSSGRSFFRNIKTQHEKFTMDARRSPRRILDDHLDDQLPKLLRGLSSPNWIPDFGDHPPIPMKTSPVPADDRFGCDDDEGVFPSRPRSTDTDPE